MQVREFLGRVAMELDASVENAECVAVFQRHARQLEYMAAPDVLQGILITIALALKPPEQLLPTLVLGESRLTPQNVHDLLLRLAWVKGGCMMDDAQEVLMLEHVQWLYCRMLDAMVLPSSMPRPKPKLAHATDADQQILAQALIEHWGVLLADPECLSPLVKELRSCPPGRREDLLRTLLCDKFPDAATRPPSAGEFAHEVRRLGRVYSRRQVPSAH
jgi:hypothetical protein